MSNGNAPDAAPAVAPAVTAQAGDGLVVRELRRSAAGVREAFHVVFADGRPFESRPGAPAFTLRFKTRRAQLLPALFGHIGLLEAFFDGDLDVEGHLRALLRVGLSGRFGGGGA